MQIQINDLKIGDSQPCRVIAEIGNNHMSSISSALEMATQAKRCGADILKTQLHAIDDKRRWRRCLIVDEHIQLMQHCKDIGIKYLCTPFTLEAARKLNDIGVSAFKIGSGQSEVFGFVDKMALFGKPLIISYKPHWALFACNNAINLVVDNLKGFKYSARGYSCHSPTIYPALAAVALGAKVVEKHVIWDKKQICPDQYNSIDFNQLHELIIGIREIEEKL